MPKVEIPYHVLQADRRMDTAPFELECSRELHNLERDITLRVRYECLKRAELAQIHATTGKLLEQGTLPLLEQLTDQAHFLVERLEDNQHELARLHRKLVRLRKRLRADHQSADRKIARLMTITRNGKPASEKLAILEEYDDLTRPVRPQSQSQATALPTTRARTRRTV